jgi:hypothetical protein
MTREEEAFAALIDARRRGVPDHELGALWYAAGCPPASQIDAATRARRARGFRVPVDPERPSFDRTFRVSLGRWLRSSRGERAEWARRRQAAAEAAQRNQEARAPGAIRRAIVRAFTYDNYQQPPPLRTKTGRILSDAEIDELAAEAERGYDVDKLRRRGKP